MYKTPESNKSLHAYVVLRPGAQTTAEELQAWCAARLARFQRARLFMQNTEDLGWELFRDQEAKRLTVQVLRKIQRWCDGLGIERIHIHSFRHSLALRLVNAGMSPAVLCKILGYSTPYSPVRSFVMMKKAVLAGRRTQAACPSGGEASRNHQENRLA